VSRKLNKSLDLESVTIAASVCMWVEAEVHARGVERPDGRIHAQAPLNESRVLESGKIPLNGRLWVLGTPPVLTI
jgi:hypothetical protein